MSCIARASGSICWCCFHQCQTTWHEVIAHAALSRAQGICPWLSKIHDAEIVDGLQKQATDAEGADLLLDFSSASHSDADTNERFHLDNLQDSPGLSSKYGYSPLLLVMLCASSCAALCDETSCS